MDLVDRAVDSTATGSEQPEVSLTYEPEEEVAALHGYADRALTAVDVGPTASSSSSQSSPNRESSSRPDGPTSSTVGLMTSFPADEEQPSPSSSGRRRLALIQEWERMIVSAAAS